MRASDFFTYSQALLSEGYIRMESFCVKLIQGPPSRNAVTSTISPTCYYLVILFPAYTWAEEFRPDIWLEV